MADKDVVAHTPGPWEIDEAGWPVVINGPQDENGLDMVCYIDAADANGDGYQAHIAHANARLIAAAPNLLAALQMVCDSGVSLAEPIERAMLDALKKARGER